MTKYADIINNYKHLNITAKKNATVFFGADWLNEIPIAELIRDNYVDSVVYNRSLKGLTLDDAEQIITECVCDLNPDKVFINIGENDIIKADFDIKKFTEKYEWLLYTIHSKCNCKIYILSVIRDNQNLINSSLKNIAEKYICEYIDLRTCEKSVLKFFSKIRFFLRSKPITFYEAINV